MSKNPIEIVTDRLGVSVPSAIATLDLPRDMANGIWFLDVARGPSALVVQWQKDKGFGLTYRKERVAEFGTGCDEVIPSDDIDRVLRTINEKLTY